MTNLESLCQTPTKLAMALIKTVDIPNYVQTPDSDMLAYYTSGYKTSDGEVFPNFNDALNHECKWLKEPAEGAKKVCLTAKAKHVSNCDNA